MMMGMGAPSIPTFDKDTDPATIEAQKMYFQNCAQFHYQMMVQYQSAYMQLLMQQQMLQNESLSSAGQKNGSQFNGPKPGMEMPMMGQANPGMIGMMPGMMPNMAGGLAADQQQFMQFQAPFMPMMYPGAAGSMNFPGKGKDK